MLLPLEPSIVTSACPLLPAEVADEYLPVSFMRVPRFSAWIPMQIDVADFADDVGTVAREALREALHHAVDEGDRLHDVTEWLAPQIEYDSWLNRRLAIALRGWGDLVARRGADPADIATLRELETLAAWACKTIQLRSQQLAVERRWCPALDEAGARILRQQAGPWRRRWKKAVREVALRHRNLTTMSPWDVFPGKNAADLRYANLLPAVRFADSVSFQCNVTIQHWNPNEFKGFHERVAAIVRCNGGRELVAMEV